MKPTPLPGYEPESKYIVRWLIVGILIGFTLAIGAEPIVTNLLSKPELISTKEQLAISKCRDIQKSEVSIAWENETTVLCSTKRGLNVVRISI